MQTLQPGTTLQDGKYEIARVLGTGSFGVTYLATARMTVSGSLGEVVTHVKVALKEFFMEEINTRADRQNVEGSQSHIFVNYRRKFRREAENLSHVKHPNIVGVLDVFDENNTTYYAMQYVEGRNLDEYIAAKGRLGVAETSQLLSDVMAALEFIHSKRMLHLDLKPKNIMRGTDGHIYLIDFGLSKQYTEQGEPESSTSLGFGTPGYASPEQALGRNDGTFPATLDVYSLGATMYKMLTGIRPPQALDIFNDGFPEDVMIKAGLSGEIIDIVRKSMAPSRKQRYQTVKEVREALEKVGMTTDIKPVSVHVSSGSTNSALHEDGTEVTEIVKKETRRSAPVCSSSPKKARGEGQVKKVENGTPLIGKKVIVGAVSVVLFIVIASLAVSLPNRKGSDTTSLKGVSEMGVEEAMKANIKRRKGGVPNKLEAEMLVEKSSYSKDAPDATDEKQAGQSSETVTPAKEKKAETDEGQDVKVSETQEEYQVKLQAALSVMTDADADNRCSVTATINNPSDQAVSTTVTLTGGGTGVSFNDVVKRIAIPAHGRRTVSSYFLVYKNGNKAWVSVTTSHGGSALRRNLTLRSFVGVQE